MRTFTITIFCFLLLTSTSVFAQQNGLNVTTETKIMGKNYMDNSDIKGVELMFPDQIQNYFIDTVSNFLSVQLRDCNSGGKKYCTSGNILQYDLMNKRILWSKKIDYQTDELLKFGNLLIYNDSNDSYGIDAKTGIILGKMTHPILYANPEKNICMAYKRLNSNEFTNILVGYSLNNKQLWSRNINREYGWNDLFYLNDSTLLVVAAGLHTININTGEGWDYNTITGEKIYSSDSDGAMMMGMMFGLVGALLYSAVANNDAVRTEENVIRDINSNTLIDNEFIYFASQEQMAKIDKQTGKIAWQNRFNRKWTSKSSIFMDDSVVYMINHGYAFRNNNHITHGRTFIAAFDKQSGKQIYNTLLKYGTIIDFKQIGKELYVLFQTRIVKYNLETGSYSSIKIYPNESLKVLKNFIDEKTFFILHNGNIVNPMQTDSTHLHIYSNQRKIFSIDNSLHIINKIDYKDDAVCFLVYDNYEFVANREKTFIINKEGQIIAELNVSSNAFIVGDYLYDKKDRSFYAVDLKEVL